MKIPLKAHCDRDPLLKVSDGVGECDALSSFRPYHF